MTLTVSPEGTMVITGEHIELYRLMCQRGALRLEQKGLKRSGRSLTATLKQHYNIRGNRQALIDHITTLIDTYPLNSRGSDGQPNNTN